LTSDQPVNFSFYEALPKDRRGETVANPWRSEIAGRTGIEQAKIKRVLNKNKDYLTNKIFFDYISKSKLGTAELKDLPLNFQIEYAKEAVKGRPRFTGLDGQTNLTRDPNYKIMEFARRSWDNTKGKGQIKFFDKNGKLIEWKYGSTLPYKDVSFSYKGKNFGLNDLKQPGFSKKFFPEVVAKQEAINNLLVEEIYNPIRKKTTSFKQLANDVQVKGYGWEKRAGVMDILHGEKGVTGEPFTNLRYNSRDINLLENGLYSSFKAGKISEANYKLALNNLNKVFDEASQGLTVKQFKQMGYRCNKSGGGEEDVACYMKDVIQTKEDLKSNDPIIRAKALTKQRKAANAAKKIPELFSLFRKGLQGTLGTIGGPAGAVVEGLIEAGTYDYFSRKGYTDKQAAAETFFAKTFGLGDLKEGEGRGLFEDATKLIEKEIAGKDPAKLRYLDNLKKQEEIYNEIASLEAASSGEQYLKPEQSEDLKNKLKLKLTELTQLKNKIKPGSPDYETWKEAEERQQNKAGIRAEEYKKNQIIP
jgi:hypothetical protein